MLATRRGRIVNVASRSVVPPAGGFIAYTVAKAGVIALTQALAHEVRGRGVTVNPVFQPYGMRLRSRFVHRIMAKALL